MVSRAAVAYSLVWLNPVSLALATVMWHAYQLQSAFQTACALVPLVSNASQIIALNAGRELLTAVGALEGIVLWVVGAYKSTYRCLLGLAINGVVDVVMGAVQGVEQATHVIEQAFTGQHDDSTTLSTTMQHVQERVHNWTSPDAVDALDTVLRRPFDAVSQQINETFSAWQPAPMEGCTGHVVPLVLGVLGCLLVLSVASNAYLVYRSLHRKPQPRWYEPMTQPLAVYCLIVGVVGALTQFALAILLPSMDDINAWIAGTEMDLNTHALGIVRETATAANHTVAAVVDHITAFLKETLGGTILEKPATDVLSCLILLKLEKMEQGLTWMADHSYVNLTRINHPVHQDTSHVLYGSIWLACVLVAIGLWVVPTDEGQQRETRTLKSG
ncbi:hypothetical protein BCR43DRAFT_516402 [Syncephalastrum racemosum]|uniref:Plasma membrane fusion protein PRM1 n=1 Tax=Syncephalastrum racemosum TaxID=13706 RepID=A0A1X2H863_SYNRA|nr:hypothetical protein BCR43DRAFT_516402 [Syncephalastrum racemosum]